MQNFPLAHSRQRGSLKSSQVAPVPAFEVPFKETNLILSKDGGDVPPGDNIAWSKPGINPLRDHIAASVGWSVGFNDHTVRVERTQNLFSISCYPPVNIAAYQLVGSGIVHSASLFRTILERVDVSTRYSMMTPSLCLAHCACRGICEATRTPLVVDNLHHQLNGTEPWKDLPWERILATWHGQRPKLHYAEQDPAKRAGAHSAYLHADVFQAFSSAVPFGDFDVMLECKAKDLALLKLREDLKGMNTRGLL
jgi:hypothetical protein